MANGKTVPIEPQALPDITPDIDAVMTLDHMAQNDDVAAGNTPMSDVQLNAARERIKANRLERAAENKRNVDTLADVEIQPGITYGDVAKEAEGRTIGESIKDALPAFVGGAGPMPLMPVKKLPHYIQDSFAQLYGGPVRAMNEFMKSSPEVMRGARGPVGLGYTIVEEMAKKSPEAAGMMRNLQGVLGPAATVVYKNMDKRIREGEISKDAYLETLPSDVQQAIASGDEGATRQAMTDFMSESMPTLPTPEPETVPGALVGGISQFVTSMMIGRGAGIGRLITKNLPKNIAAGSFADAYGFDPNLDTLAEWSKGTIFDKVVPDFLASEPGDTKAEKRFKNALEGLVPGAVAEAVFWGFRALKGQRVTGDELKIVGDALTENADTEIQTLMGAVDPKAPLVDKAGNINLNRYKDGDTKALLSSWANTFPDQISKARGATKTHDQTMAKAAKRTSDLLGLDPDKMVESMKAAGLTEDEALATRYVAESQLKNLKALAKPIAEKGLGGSTDVEKVAFLRQASVVRGVMEELVGKTATAGRTLNQFRIMSETPGMRVQEMQDLVKAVDDGAVESLARMVNQSELPAQIAGLAKGGSAVLHGQGERFFTGMNGMFLRSILSGAGTHQMNILGNVTGGLLSLGEHAVAENIIQPLMNGLSVKRAPQVAAGETMSMIYASRAAWYDSWNAAGHIMKTGVPPQQAKFASRRHNYLREPMRGVRPEDLGIEGQGTKALFHINNWIDSASGAMDYVSFRPLGAMDAVARETYGRQKLYQLAHRQAWTENKQGDDLTKRVMEIVDDPPPEYIEAAEQYASNLTYQDQGGRVARGIASISSLPVGRWIAPFMRVTTNLARWSMWDRGPFYAMRTKFREELQEGGAQSSLAVTKFMSGMSIMMAVSEMVGQGKVTGGGPKDRKASAMVDRVAGSPPPYSMKIGNDWVAYERGDPIAWSIGLAADIAEVQSWQWDDDDEPLAMMGFVFARLASSKHYMRGLAQALSPLTMGERGGMQALQNLGEGLVIGTVYPNILGQFRSFDETRREADTFMEKLVNRTPLGYGPPQTDVFGRVAKYHPRWGIPIVGGIEYLNESDTNDPVVAELIKQEVKAGNLPRRKYGVALNAEQRSAWGLLVGELDLYSALQESIDSYGYEQAGYDGGGSARNKELTDIIGDYRTEAFKVLLEQDKDLARRVDMKELAADFRSGATREDIERIEQ